MATPFTRTLRSLEADDHRRSLLGLAVVALLLAGWGWWFFTAEVAIYAGAEWARLEVAEEGHAVGAPVDGAVAAVFMALDDEVALGEVLVELGSEEARIARDEALAQIKALTREAAALAEERAVLALVQRQEQQAALAALAAARARVEEATARAEFAEGEAQRAAQLHAAGQLATAERDRLHAEAKESAAALERVRQSAEQLAWSQRARVSQLQIQQAALQGKEARVQGEQAAASAAADRFAYQIEQRQIRAPVAGRLGEVAPLRAGAFVEEGQVLATVVPPGQLRVVAAFAPHAAGRLASGARAQLKLDAYPWAQYGAVTAEVMRVGREVREGRVRVELAVVEMPAAISAQHGLPGLLEVEIERLTPAALVLRSAGQLLTARSAGAAR